MIINFRILSKIVFKQYLQRDPPLPKAPKPVAKCPRLVTFQNNVVDATQLNGGYVGWQLIPNGNVFMPASQKTPQGINHTGQHL